VGAVVDGEFTTTTAITMVTVVQRGASETGPTLLEGLEGNEAVLPCISSGGTSATCEWTSPYGTQMSLEPGEYAGRGRLLAGDDCSLKVSSLQGRDEGSWICRVGNSQRAISLTIETPLKLSAPTSILQQADERATLVCHANKEYASCEWETPYGRTVSFSDNHREEESGRLQYFGFSSMDCGIVIRDIGTRDSGGWTCRVSATVAGKHQVSADIVRLFVEPSQFAGHEKPRALQPPAPAPAPDYGFGDYDRGVPLKETNEYDAFDYVNGDFDKVAATRPTLPRPGVVSQTQADQSSGVVRPQASSTLPPQVSQPSSPNPNTSLNQPPKIQPQKITTPEKPNLEILANKTNIPVEKSVFGSEHCWNDLTIKDKDSSLDCSEFRKKKRGGNKSSGQVTNFVPMVPEN